MVGFRGRTVRMRLSYDEMMWNFNLIVLSKDLNKNVLYGIKYSSIYKTNNMHKLLILFSFVLVCYSCQQAGKSTAAKETATEIVKPKINYPNDMVKVFDNHGGLAKWHSMKSMSYDIVKEGGNETQMIDLHSRAERIKAATFESGYDGKNYWVVADTSYKSNPKFYTNLMFYFYAMPFVLADGGINYDKIDPLTFDGKEYPGYRISYGDGVGISPQDEYFIHYDANTHEMAWLGYTVTFFSGEKSEKISWIRYDDWKQFNGLKLPNTTRRGESF